MTEVWTKWEGQDINGVYPLRKFLGASNHSAVFLTDYKGHYFSIAAIKLVPADPVLAEAQLARWRTAAGLSHPHLVGLLDAGRCQLGDQPYLFVVMEYAEETLGQTLPHRALSPDEVRQMLVPTFDALTFLHGKNLMQGQLKPSNIMVVNDELKLASDTIRPTGVSSASIARPSLYDPPEAKFGRNSPAGDIWALGITLVESLAQAAPTWPDERSEAVALPANFPREFEDLVRRCLRRNPAQRPTVADFDAQFRKPSKLLVEPLARPAIREASGRAARRAAASKRRSIVPAVGGSLLVLGAVWAGWRFFSSTPDAPQGASSSDQTAPPHAPSVAETPTPTAPAIPSPAPSAPAAGVNPVKVAPPAPRAAPPSAPEPAKGPADGPRSVVHQEIPDVPRSARMTIHGVIKVMVRLSVDRSGRVSNEAIEVPGPSKYFARLATEAAKKWRFSTATSEDARKRLLQFEFSRSGTTVNIINLR